MMTQAFVALQLPLLKVMPVTHEQIVLPSGTSDHVSFLIA